MGIGAGSFYTVIGSYDGRYVGRDCHNTYIRCGAELGVVGFVLLAAMIVNAFLILRRTSKLATGTPVENELGWDCFGLQLAIIGVLTCGIFMGLTYLEEFWWVLGLPVCLERSALNARSMAPALGDRRNSGTLRRCSSQTALSNPKRPRGASPVGTSG
jgi:hypothetical protein